MESSRTAGSGPRDSSSRHSGMAEPPADDNTIDGGGSCLVPGFIDAHTHLGISENGLAFEGDDINEDSEPSTPHMRALDAINQFDLCFTEALQAGVTTVAVAPGSANPVGGQICVMKTFVGGSTICC